MDIAFVKTKYVSFGGGEGYLQTLMQHCVARDFRVHLLTSSWSGQEPAGVSIHQIPMKRHSRKARVFSFAEGVSQHLRDHRYDACLSLERTVGQQVWRGGEGVHKRWLSLRREFESPFKNLTVQLSPFQRALLQLEENCIHNTPYLIANSDMVKRDILSCFPDLDPGKISVIYNGVDAKRFNLSNRETHRQHIRAELNLADSQPLLLLAGSGFRRKGVQETLTMLRDLKDGHLVVMGRDKTTRWSRMAMRLGVASRVSFLAPTHDLCPYFHAANVTLVPSWYDPFPNVGVESLACGTPVVTTRVCGTSDVIQEGINGSVFGMPSDRSDFLASVNCAMKIPAGEALAATVATLTPEHNLDQTLSILIQASQH